MSKENSVTKEVLDYSRSILEGMGACAVKAIDGVSETASTAIDLGTLLGVITH